jgi:hypothetical protein
MARGRWWAGLGALLGVWLGAAAAGAALITFDEGDPPNGTVVSDQYQAEFGLTISAHNTGGGPNLAVLFDSSLRGTRDPDLEFAKTGNLAFFNILIIQENDIGCGDGVCDEPDDEGSRPAGSITFSFEPSAPVLSFGFDLLDIEDEDPETMGMVLFYSGGSGGTLVESTSFADFAARDGALFGDNSANRVSPFVFSEADAVDTVVFEMGGSGALDNVGFELVPEPATAGLLGLGLLGLVWSGHPARRAAR